MIRRPGDRSIAGPADDPTRLPAPDRWRERYVAEYGNPAEERATVLVVWELEGGPVGFSTADKEAARISELGQQFST